MPRDKDHGLVLYEYPFNESVRTLLRLEHLFDRLGQLMPRNTPVDHHFSLVTLFEILDVASRADLKSELLKDLERHRALMAAYRKSPQVSKSAIDDIQRRLDHAFDGLNLQPGKPGISLNSNEWLMSVRSRISIPAGTCEFDLPAYYAWQQLDAARRRSDLEGWAATLAPLAEAVQVLLQFLREAGAPHKVFATAGQYQQTLPQGKSYQLLRLRLDGATGLVPEISGHRLLVSVRLMRCEPDGRLRPAADELPLELTLCG
jgi:cell division protein ZapD